MGSKEYVYFKFWLISSTTLQGECTFDFPAKRYMRVPFLYCHQLWVSSRFLIVGSLVDQGLANSFYKGPNFKYFQLYGGKKISVTTIQLCHCSAKAAVEDTKWVWLCPVNLYLQKQLVNWIRSMGRNVVGNKCYHVLICISLAMWAKMSIFLYLQNFIGLCTDIKDIAVIRQYFSPQELFGGAGETDSKDLSV